MSDEDSGQDQPERKGSGTSGGIRVPPILMVPVGVGVGWLMANWIGAILGGIMGFFLWRSRA